MSDVRLDMLERMSASGWSGLDLSGAGLAEQAQQMRIAEIAEAAPIAAALATPEGRLLLDWIVSKTLLRPPSDEEQQTRDPGALAILKAKREGQDSIAWMLLRAQQVVRNAGGRT